MNFAAMSIMRDDRKVQLRRIALLLCAIAGLWTLPAAANEKEGMPDLSQIEQTCLPTSTANLIIWFGHHGYPKLIASGATDDERYLHTVHIVMADTDARFDWGTQQDKVTVGIEKYIHDAGYQCDVEYRGMDWTQAVNAIKTARGEPLDPDDKPPLPFTQDWLKENDDPNKGFILLLAYCAYDQNSNSFTNAWDAGHAVTLVNAEPDMILIHDPAHEDDEPGRKILTPQVLTSGNWREQQFTAPVSGLMLLSGSLLEAPPNAGVMLTGAVCITMHPLADNTLSSTNAAGGPNSSMAGKGAGTSPSAPATPAAPAAPASASSGWAMWLFDLLFKK
jgi:hypothetical protein